MNIVPTRARLGPVLELFCTKVRARTPRVGAHVLFGDLATIALAAHADHWRLWQAAYDLIPDRGQAGNGGDAGTVIAIATALAAGLAGAENFAKLTDEARKLVEQMAPAKA